MKIQVVGLTIVALMLGAAAAHAQGTPKAEMSLGYAYMHDNDLSDNFPKGFVASIGGYFSDWFALVGDEAQRTVNETFFDKAFIGVDGAHGEHGMTTNYPDQAAIHRAMMRQARQRIVLADHRKIGAVGRSLIWPTNDTDKLITDKSTTDEAIAAFTAKEIVVLRA